MSINIPDDFKSVTTPTGRNIPYPAHYPPSEVHPDNFGVKPGASPVRSRPRRGATSSFDGFFASSKAYGPAPFESLLERDFQTLLDVDPRIINYAVQAHRLTYWAPDRDGRMIKRTYTPDFVAEDRDGRIIVMEVKANALAARSTWSRLEPYIRAAYTEEHGALFIVMTEDVIRVQPRLANCQIMLHHARALHDHSAELAIRNIISVGEMASTLGTICAKATARGIDDRVAFSTIMRLATQGVLTLDLSKPLSLNTAFVRVIH